MIFLYYPIEDCSVREIVGYVNLMTQEKEVVRVYWHEKADNTKVMSRYLLKQGNYDIINSLDKDGKEYTDYRRRRV